MLLNLLLVIPFHFLLQIGHVGLALATSLAAFLNAGLLYRGLRKGDVYRPAVGWVRYFFQLLIANSVMAIVLIVGLNYFQGWSELAVMQRITSIAFICIVGFSVYIVILLLFGFRLKDVRQKS